MSQHYQNAIGELRRPAIQRGLWNFAQTTPRDLVRGRISVPEIQQRALAHVPDELLVNVPEDKNAYTLFQGFQASIPEEGIEYGRRRRFGRRGQNQRLIGDGANEEETGPPALKDLKKERSGLNHRLEMLEVRKNMCSTEIYEIDSKIANMNTMRKIVLDRLANLEQEEAELEHELLDIDNRLEDLEEELEDEAALAQKSPTTQDGESGAERGATGDFMSESIYEKIPTTKGPKPPRRKKARRVSHPVLHEHLEPGSKLRELQAHNDMVTAIDFDIPFGTAVTAALDDTVRVWDLSAGRCMGLLEGHLSSVRCLQVEDNIVATGSMDASIRLWDLSKAEYSPMDRGYGDDEEDGLAFENSNDAPPPPPENSMSQCPLFTLEAHVAEITALHFRNDTLVSGSADKTLRQWDLVKGRCVQTLDVLWAAAQASATMGSNDGQWRQTGRLPDASADFVGALQVFDAALACGTADGMVRLWDLRSGQVHRSLVGHTGPVTALQFDDVHLVTGSMDRSVRVSASFFHSSPSFTV